MTAFFLAMVLTAILTPIVIVVARHRGWIAQPRADRWHSRPTALMGGIALFGGTTLTWWLTGTLPQLHALAIPAAGMFLLGLIDDRVYELQPHHKLVAQVVFAAMLVAGGVRIGSLHPLLALPLTVLWIVGITNAVNLLDNMDGLAAGVTSISATVLAVCALGAGGGWTTAGMLPHDSGVTSGAALALAGACTGFLLFNFNPARIFMGDCGALFLGFTLGALTIMGPHHCAPNFALSMLLPVLVVAVPIFDTTLVAVARAANGRPIMPGFRDHSSHRMVLLGLSERGTAFLMYGLAILFGSLAVGVNRIPSLGVVLLAAVLLCGLLLLGLYLGTPKVYPEATDGRAAPTLAARLHGQKRFIQVLFDLLLIPVAFVGAHLLRFEGVLPLSIAAGVLKALPLVLVVKFAALALLRAYRGVWRFAGVSDILRAVAGSMLGSVVAAVALYGLNRFDGLSRGALVVDFVIFTLFAIGTRLGYLVLQHLFGTLPTSVAPPVYILGADDETMALLNQLRDPLSPRRARILGILDDDPEKQHRSVNGVPVLGPIRALPGLIHRNGDAICLLGVSPYSPTGKRILRFCRQAGIDAYPDVNTLLHSSDGEPARAAFA